MNKVLIINGSHRAGNTDLAMKKLGGIFSQKNIEFRELRLREIEIKLPDGCENCAEGEICPNIKDEFSEKIEPTIRDYDIYIIATPTWDDGVTPLTKIFWDRIVGWCHEDRMYLKDKKLAVITHGMAGMDSWKHVINWVKSVCIWEKCNFGGSLTFESGSNIGGLDLIEKPLQNFVAEILI